MQKREYGSGSIYYLESRKRWAASLKIGVNANGSPKKKTITGKTKKEVKDKLRMLQAEVLTGNYTEPSKLTLPQISHSINDNKKAMNLVKENTYNRNQYVISIIEKSSIGRTPIQKITEPTLTAFLSEVTGYSNSVIKKIYGVLNSSLKKALKMGLITFNPLEDVIRPNSKKETRKIRALTVEEQKAFIEAINSDASEPYRTMLLLSLFTGMRMGEVCALMPSDILMNGTMLNISKTMTRDENYKAALGTTTKTYAGLRRLTLTPPIQKLIKSFLKNSYRENEFGLLFVDKKNKMITTNQVNSYYKRLIQRYSIGNPDEFNQHQLRHTYATRCIESGMPVKVLQHQLGHADVTTTLNTYCDVFDNFAENYIDKAQQYLEKNNIAI